VEGDRGVGDCENRGWEAGEERVRGVTSERVGIGRKKQI